MSIEALPTFKFLVFLKNIFFFCQVDDKIQKNFFEGEPVGAKSQYQKNGLAYQLLMKIAEKCSSERNYLCLKKPKRIGNSFRKLFSQWRKGEKIEELDPIIKGFIENKKFPDELYRLRELIERYRQLPVAQALSENNSGLLEDNGVDSLDCGQIENDPTSNVFGGRLSDGEPLQKIQRRLGGDLLALDTLGVLQKDDPPLFRILDRRLSNGEALFKVQWMEHERIASWEPLRNLECGLDLIWNFELHAAEAIVGAKLLRISEEKEEMWVQVRWNDHLECKVSWLKFYHVPNGCSLLQKWFTRGNVEISYDLKSWVDMIIYAGTPCDQLCVDGKRPEFLDISEVKVASAPYFVNPLSESEQASRLSMLSDAARHMIVALSLYSGSDPCKGFLVSRAQMWNHFCIVNMVNSPTRQAKEAFDKAVCDCRENKILQDVGEKFVVLIDKSVATAALSHFTGGPPQQLKILEESYKFN